ncbi:MAG: glucose-6-phosphate isomerase [Lachnospiraceae bacterium]|nr:glucose-6-phosphate isomerase [Lachnospiraceae bacterium]
MLAITYQDSQNRIGTEELNRYLQANKNVLEQVKNSRQGYEEVLGWMDPEEWASEQQLARLEEKAGEIRKNADAFVLIGVGGSNNAARAVIKGLKKEGPRVYYAGNTISPYQVHELLKELEGKSVYINVIAKNFETLEPGIGFRVLRKWLADNYGDQAGSRIIATGTPGSHLEKISRENGYTFFTFPESIGGRYSAICDVGLFPMAVAGADIRKVVQGVKDMRKLLYKTEGAENPAYYYGAVRNLLNQKGMKAEMLSFFEPRYNYFAKWWIQLFAESEGKEGKGIYPISAQYSEDLHSVGQFIQEGTPMIFETFLDIKNQDASYILEKDLADDRFDYLNGKDLWEINKKAFEATYKAHTQSLPCFHIQVDQIDEYSFGELFYFFEFACYVSGMLLGINPFDQPGVEAYKKYMFEALGKDKPQE